MREDFERFGIGVGRDHHLGEDLRHPFRHLASKCLIYRDNPSKRRNAVASEGGVIGRRETGRPGDAAGVGMLYDHAGRPRIAKLGGELEGRVGVGQIVVAERLALDLPGLADPGEMRADMGVESRRLGADSRHSAAARRA